LEPLIHYNRGPSEGVPGKLWKAERNGLFDQFHSRIADGSAVEDDGSTASSGLGRAGNQAIGKIRIGSRSGENGGKIGYG